MGAFIFKQPNGLYGRYSSVVDQITDYNMTEEDVVELFVNTAKENAKIELQLLNIAAKKGVNVSYKCNGERLYERACEEMDNMYKLYDDVSLCPGMPIEEWRKVRKAMESDPGTKKEGSEC